MQLLSLPQDALRLQLQLRQLQERRRRLQEQHLLLVRLGQPRLQAPTVIDRNIGHDTEEKHSNVKEEGGQEYDEDMSSWSREDDDLLQELHHAQSRVDLLKAKLAKHWCRRHAQQAVATLVPRPRTAPKLLQRGDSLVERPRGASSASTK